MLIRFHLKRYNLNNPNETGTFVIDLPFPEKVEEAMRDGYCLEDVYVTNEATNIAPLYSNILQ